MMEVHALARMMVTGAGLEDCARHLAMSRQHEPRGHAGTRPAGPSARDLGDDGTNEPPEDPSHDLACELIRLVRSLVWFVILAQLATLGLVGGLAGLNLAIQLGVFNVQAGPVALDESKDGDPEGE
jgi:hypothetical protein